MELVLSSFRPPLLVFPLCSGLLQSLSQSRDVPFHGSHPFVWDAVPGFWDEAPLPVQGFGRIHGRGCSKAQPGPTKVLSPSSPSPLEQE